MEEQGLTWVRPSCWWPVRNAIAGRRLHPEAARASLAVRSKAGELRAIDPVKLVEAAAIDGLQVAFVRTWGWMGVGESRAIRVTAFAQAAASGRHRGDRHVLRGSLVLPYLVALEFKLDGLNVCRILNSLPRSIRQAFTRKQME